MGLYQHLRSLRKQGYAGAGSERLILWRRQPVSVRIDRPTRLDRARTLGYKPKSGIAVVRQRVDRGGRKRPDIKKGRRSRHSGQTKTLDKSYQLVAEERAAGKHPNMEVINSYFAGKDGLHYWYDVILADGNRPEITADRNLRQAAGSTGRASRGLTSAGKKSRGLHRKGKGAEKIRPSRTATVKRKYREQHPYY